MSEGQGSGRESVRGGPGQMGSSLLTNVKNLAFILSEMGAIGGFCRDNGHSQII